MMSTNNLTDSRTSTQGDVNVTRMKQELSAIYKILNTGKRTASLLDVLQNLGKIAFSDETTGLPNKTFLNYYPPP